jgi:hypothetical protein
MVQISSFYVFALAICSVSVQAAPISLSPRSSIFEKLLGGVLGGIGVLPGSAECNGARIAIVKSLGSTKKSVDALVDATGNDPTSNQAATSAKSSMDLAQAGVDTIAKALKDKTDPPAEARTQVVNALDAAKVALGGITSTDSDVTKELEKAQKNLDKTISNGQDVLNSCKSASDKVAGAAANGNVASGTTATSSALPASGSALSPSSGVASSAITNPLTAANLPATPPSALGDTTASPPVGAGATIDTSGSGAVSGGLAPADPSTVNAAPAAAPAPNFASVDLGDGANVADAEADSAFERFRNLGNGLA